MRSLFYLDVHYLFGDNLMNPGAYKLFIAYIYKREKLKNNKKKNVSEILLALIFLRDWFNILVGVIISFILVELDDDDIIYYFWIEIS